MRVGQMEIILLNVHRGGAVAVDVWRQPCTKPLIVPHTQLAPPNVVVFDPLPALAVNIGVVYAIVGNLCRFVC
jgi:hypothetical protein